MPAAAAAPPPTATASPNMHLAPQVMQALKNSKNLVPSQAWLTSFLASQRPGLPLNAIVSTAGFRLLAADIKMGLDPTQTPAFPADVVNASVKELHLAGPYVTQLLDIEDTSRSRWSQIEQIEADERGERTKGREIIRVPTLSASDAAHEGTGGPSSVDPAATATTAAAAAAAAAADPRADSRGPHKLLLEDVRGTKIYAIEVKKLDNVNTEINIGSKLLLKDLLVARGVLMLEQSNVTLLGGKVDHLHQHWRTNRKARLRESIAAT